MVNDKALPTVITKMSIVDNVFRISANLIKET